MPTGTLDSSSLTYLFPILLIVIFVVLIIVPNRRRDKKFKDMLSSLQVGDNVKTIGGVYGKIIAIKEDLITVETGPDKVKILFAKSAIATVDRQDVESDVAKK
jgi:preprotein translocase, YajC subunit